MVLSFVGLNSPCNDGVSCGGAGGVEAGMAGGHSARLGAKQD